MTNRLSVIHELLRTTSTEELVAGRASLHAVAERILAADLYARTGYVGLRPTVDGFGQPEVLTGGERRRARIVRNTLVVQHDVSETRHELTTLGDLAAAVGIELGGDLPYEPSSDAAPSTPVAISETAAKAFAVTLAFSASALERVRRAAWESNPSIYQLWPEHFDLAVQIGSVMIGASLGDALSVDGRRTPYLYVSPEEVPAPDGYWNEPYGAAIGFDELRSDDHAHAFFTTGLEALGIS